MRFYNANSPGAWAERPKGSKLVGALTSTFTVPLQDCTSFRRLRDATASIVNLRTERSSPQSQGQSSQHLGYYPPDTPSWSDTQSPIGYEGTPPPGTPVAASASRGGEAAVRQALILAATRQCIRLLRRGWDSVEAAASTVPILIGLREDGLLSPLADVQQAALDALIGLCSPAPSRRAKTVGPPAPGSFAAWTEGGPAEARTRPPSAIQLDVQRWAQQAQVFASLSEAGLLPPGDGPVRAAGVLEAELRRSLRAPTPQDLKRCAKNLAEGGSWLTRALNAESELPLEGLTIGEAPSPQLTPQRTSRLQAAPDSIRTIVAAALRSATDLDGDGPAAAATREILHRVGLIEAEEFGDCETPPSLSGRWNLPRRSSSTPGFGQTLPELRRSPIKGQPPSTVLESGFLQLQAAKAVLRENRLPAGSVPPRGVIGLRR